MSAPDEDRAVQVAALVLCELGAMDATESGAGPVEIALLCLSLRHYSIQPHEVATALARLEEEQRVELVAHGYAFTHAMLRARCTGADQ